MSSRVLIATILSASLTLAASGAAGADSPSEISKDAQDALASLYAKVDGAKALGAKALSQEKLAPRQRAPLQNLDIPWPTHNGRAAEDSVTV